MRTEKYIGTNKRDGMQIKSKQEAGMKLVRKDRRINREQINKKQDIKEPTSGAGRIKSKHAPGMRLIHSPSTLIEKPC